MSDVEFLDIEDLLGLVRRLGVGPVRDLGLLEAACARPRASVLGVEAYPTVVEKAAALLQSLATGRPLVDGNKRLGWLAVTVFLDLNSAEVLLDDEDAFSLVMDVAAGRIDLAEIIARLR